LNWQTIKFAEASSSGGISSLGLNLGSFLTQLATFVLVLLILRRWVFPKLVETLEKRRSALEESLVQAKKTEETLSQAEVKVAQILQKAREQADASLRDAKAQAAELIAKGEASAVAKAKAIIDEAQMQLDIEREKLRRELKAELAKLVSLTAEKVLAKKLDPKEDLALIDREIKDIRL
jgi:F-type H+-transporting ATPase subunit b